MPKLNWEIIRYDIAEAREQLEEIEKQIKEGKKISEGAFQVMLEHAYHHLNFAWNVRRVSTKKYANLSDKDFNKWSKFPKEMKASKLPIKRKRKCTKR